MPGDRVDPRECVVELRRSRCSSASGAQGARPRDRCRFDDPDSSPTRMTCTSGPRADQLRIAFRWMISSWPTNGFGIEKTVSVIGSKRMTTRLPGHESLPQSVGRGERRGDEESVRRDVRPVGVLPSNPSRSRPLSGSAARSRVVDAGRPSARPRRAAHRAPPSLCQHIDQCARKHDVIAVERAGVEHLQKDPIGPTTPSNLEDILGEVCPRVVEPARPPTLEQLGRTPDAGSDGSRMRAGRGSCSNRPPASPPARGTPDRAQRILDPEVGGR